MNRTARAYNEGDPRIKGIRRGDDYQSARLLAVAVPDTGSEQAAPSAERSPFVGLLTTRSLSKGVSYAYNSRIDRVA